ncbi:thioredoxin family protein [Planococcus sp. CP5-4]|uniref:thioredoxin family protein n=1 Tax=unclassified Planococcus (in: firmicutes) TaxID=2662419 RepID=UPI001C224348|nr:MULTISPECIES: thioredoxin family protein [unclassified Planococcus (in: firmicutes)]MBU9674113.1 thioredoxin family protein [Planococcus sp. CP5-4_YE]MBV0910068.1 thioredoxin family protein [Planococcus sp. CP5-4_UN]MBW6064602.1 thioredoxin family protein [Planococcus sp. CP5-4]
MKKLLIIAGVVLAIFALIVFLTNQSQDEKLADNQYGTDDLNPATIDQLDDENYQNIALPDDVNEQIQSGEPTTVYFFSPTCQFCQQTTPVLMPVADDMDVDVLQYNLLEFEQGWSDYGLEATPTLVHYEDGQEVARWTGAQPKENIEQFFQEVVKK